MKCPGCGYQGSKVSKKKMMGKEICCCKECGGNFDEEGNEISRENMKGIRKDAIRQKKPPMTKASEEVN